MHSLRNFLRSLPLSALASACFEHSSDSAVRGLASFFSAAGGLASVLVASLAAGADGCADVEPISSSEASAVAVAREENFVMGHLKWKGRAQASRGDDEPRVNETIFAATIF